MNLVIGFVYGDASKGSFEPYFAAGSNEIIIEYLEKWSGKSNQNLQKSLFFIKL